MQVALRSATVRGGDICRAQFLGHGMVEPGVGFLARSELENQVQSFASA